jgi:hypothetical protein
LDNFLRHLGGLKIQVNSKDSCSLARQQNRNRLSITPTLASRTASTYQRNFAV